MPHVPPAPHGLPVPRSTREPPCARPPLLSWVFAEGDWPGLLSLPACLRGKPASRFWGAEVKPLGTVVWTEGIVL